MSIISISGRIGSGKDTVGKIIQIISSCPQLNNEAVEAWLKRDLPKPEYEIQKWANSLKDIVCILIGCTREQLEDHKYKETELGEEWRVWYGTNYKLSNNTNNGRVTKLYTQKEGELEDLYTDVNPKIVITSIQTQILTPRLLLQLLGTECGRDIIHPNIWCNSLMSKYNKIFIDKDFIKSDGTSNELEYPNWIITDTRFPNEHKAVKDKGGITIRVIRPNPKGIKEEIENLHASETALDNATFDYDINNTGSVLDLIGYVREILTKERIINN